MARRASIVRCVGVWVAVTVAAAGLLSRLAGDLLSAQDQVRSGGLNALPFDQLLVVLAALAVMACALWFWLVTTLVTLEAASRGATATTSRLSTPGCPQWLRRLLFAACGLVLAAGFVAPANAVERQAPRPQPGAARLAGLPLPERPSSQSSSVVIGVAASGPAVQVHAVQVHAGDTLWSLAASALAPDAGNAEIAATWQELYELNRTVIGDDPDLILPDTTLSIPDLKEESR